MSAANAAAASIPDILAAVSSWKVGLASTFEEHNDVGSARSVQQKTKQKVTVALTCRNISGAALALMAAESSAFLNRKGTPKRHITIQGKGSDGSFSRTIRYCTLDTGDDNNASADKGIVDTLNFTGEEIV